MSKVDYEEMTLTKWIILVGQDGISLLEKGRNDRFDVIVAHRYPQEASNAKALIQNLMAYFPNQEVCDVVLDDHVTRVSYSQPGVIQSTSSVIEDFGRVTVHFHDILKQRACQLESEKSDLEELVEVFSPFFSRIRRFVLRGPTQDFRYIVSVDTAAVIKKPYAWYGSIRTVLSTVLINRVTAGLNLIDRDATQWVEATAQVTAPIASVVVPPAPKDIATAPIASLIVPPAPREIATAPVASVVVTPIPKDITVTNGRPIAAEIVSPRPMLKDIAVTVSRLIAPQIAKPRPTPIADSSTSMRESKGKLTFIFSASDDPAIALLAAGVVWSLPKESGQTGPVTVTEIGAYRKKLVSPFRKLIGVTAHQETETLPMPTDRLKSLIEDISAYAKQPGDHVLFFGYEILSTDLLVHISRFLQETPVRYQIIVCNDSVGRVPHLMGFETVFDGLARKSWIYFEGSDQRRANLRTQLPHWKTYKTPRLDDAILKKILEGEFRVVEKLRPSKTNLSISQSSAFAQWREEFSASTANS